ncbi:MAG: amidohydrolase family protein [Holophagales bacterium]|nr:amidohydrolase family protein [Holophagales bacterium]
MLLFGGTALTMDGEMRILDDAEIFLQGGRIAAIGRNLTVLPGTKPVDVSGHWILPGLIQGHVHLGQTFFRGLAEGRRLLPWLRERIWPLEAAHDEESAYWCGLQGAAEALLAGTTTIQEIGIGPGAPGLLRAIAESGLRGFAGKCLMDVGEALPEAMREETDACLAGTESLGEKLEQGRLSEAERPADHLRYVLNPRFILTGSDALWQGVQALAEGRGWPVHTHALEQKEETEIVRREKDGRDEIRYFEDLGLLDVDLRLAHGVWLDAEHRRTIGGRRVSLVHCPSANLKLGSGIADVVGHRAAGLAVGIGCDGVACNNGLDVLEEVRLAALLQKHLHGPESFPGREALSLATREGARALGLEQEVGSIEVGKRADLVVLTGDRPELWADSQADPHDLIAFSASRANVRHVLVDGEMLVEDGRLAHLDLDAVRRGAERARADLLARAGIEVP